MFFLSTILRLTYYLIERKYYISSFGGPVAPSVYKANLSVGLRLVGIVVSGGCFRIVNR